jgi:riboflavin biosynthesis pyrimidine reductase
VTDLGIRLEALFETADLPQVELPAELEAAYGGPFHLPEEVVYANFVSSIDGVAAIAGVEMSSATISGAAPSDRSVMALLRAVADAVVVGSGTLREHGGPWTAERAFPPGADAYRRARAALSSEEAPTLVVVTASGDLPPDHPALGAAVVITTSSGARAIAQRQIRCADVIDVGDYDEVSPPDAIGRLRERGHRRILTEGGPTLMGSMLEASVVEQLFLTISPTLIGGASGRVPLSDGADLLDGIPGAKLLSVRRADHHLFLRYELPVRETGRAG